MRYRISVFYTLLIFSLLTTGCPSNEQPKTNTNAAANQTTAGDANGGNSAMSTSKTPTEATVNDAPTVAPVFKAYCDAMTKKDEAALRKVYSQSTLRTFEADMKAENEKSLVKHLEADQVSNKLCEVRNEKIEGDAAVAEVKTEGAPNGFKVKFVRENGEWKLTNEFPDFKDVEKSAANSNAAR